MQEAFGFTPFLHKFQPHILETTLNHYIGCHRIWDQFGIEIEISQPLRKNHDGTPNIQS